MGRGPDPAAGAWEYAPDRPFGPWFAAHRCQPAELEEERSQSPVLERELRAPGAAAAGLPEDAPLFSVVMPLYRTPAAYLRDSCESVLAQTFPGLELVLVDSTPDSRESPSSSSLGEQVAALAARDSRVVEARPEPGAPTGIVDNTNLGVSRARGALVCFMDHDDLLEPDALFRYAQALLASPEADVLYCDEDICRIAPDGTMESLHALFKPDYSPELLLCKQYVLHLMAVRRSLLESFMPLGRVLEGAQDYELALRSCELARSVVHVPRLLYHWRQGEGSTAADPEAKAYGRKPYLLAAAGALRRLGSDASLVTAGAVNVHNPWFQAPSPAPLVSVVAAVASAEEARWCAESLAETLRYPHVELVLAGPGPTLQELGGGACAWQGLPGGGTPLMGGQGPVPGLERVASAPLDAPASRFAAWNAGAARASGEYLAFVDGGARYVTPQPLEQLLGVLGLPGVGLASPKALYSDMSVHSHGIALTPAGMLPLYRGVRHDHPCHQCDAACLKDMSAASAHGCMVSRALFEGLGGFDEGFSSEVASADLCARVRERGLRVVAVPDVKLQLEEACPEPRFSDAPQPDFPAEEVAAFDAKHPGLRAGGDPCFNPNFDQGWAWCALPRR